MRIKKKARVKTQYQKITLILETGKRITYTGEVQLFDGDRIVGIEVTEGIDLPKDFFWEEIK